MGSSARSTASSRSKESMDSANSRQSARIRAAILAKQRIEGVLEKKKHLASMLNRRAFLRRFGSSKSMEATLDSMELELSDFEKAIGREIMGSPPEKDDRGNRRTVFSFDLAGQEQGKKKDDADEVDNRDANSEATPFDEEDEDQKTSPAESKSIGGRTLGSMSYGAISATTRKISNVAPDLPPQVEDVRDSESSDDDSDESEDEDEPIPSPPKIEYRQIDGEAFRWFDRIVREGDFCLDYTCRLIECDPTDMYSRTKAAIADITGAAEQEGVEVVQKEVEKVEKPEEEKPQKKKWFRGSGASNKSNTTIELKNADPALDDLTDSDSWMSEDKNDEDSDDDVPKKYESKLLSSSPEEYFAAINASPKPSNRAGGHGKKKVNERLQDGQVMCEI